MDIALDNNVKSVDFNSTDIDEVTFNGNTVYYKQRELIGTSPMYFKALGFPLKDYRISGESVQDGTPAPNMLVDVFGCGLLDETQQTYKLPLTINSIEHPIYLGQIPTTRRIKKVALTGNEGWFAYTIPNSYYNTTLPIKSSLNHLSNATKRVSALNELIADNTSFAAGTSFIIRMNQFSSLNDFKSYLTAQYAAGSPVTIWYVLTEPETAIINEPLYRIGDYADSISFAQAGVTIPTARGDNVLDITSPVKPSEIYIKGNIKPDGYGKLVDMNGVYILDKNGMQLTVHGQGQ